MSDGTQALPGTDGPVHVTVHKTWEAPEKASQFGAGFKLKMALWSLAAVAILCAGVGVPVTLSVLRRSSHTNGTPAPSPPPGTPAASPPPPSRSPPPLRSPPPNPPPGSPGTSPATPSPPGASPAAPPPPGASPAAPPSPGTSPATPPPPSSTNVIPTPSGSVPFDVPSGWTALWWDEFEGSSLNADYWSYAVGNGDWYGKGVHSMRVPGL